MQKSIEDKTPVRVSGQQLSYAQLADINSVYAGSIGDSSALSPIPSTEVATMHDSALLAITPPDSEYIEQLSGRRAGVIEYVVQDGDLLSFIASDYGVSQVSIMWANALTNPNNIKPGQILRIPPITGVIHKVLKGDTASSLAKKYGADADRIIAYNRLPIDGSLAISSEIIIPNGVLKASRTTGIATKLATTVVAQFTHLPDLGDYFIRPTTGIITRNGAIHGRNGIDIANSYGTPIKAAADGVVAISDASGYNGGYGRYIKLSHGNGTETLYGHASKLLVEVGQSVHKGDVIALMGSTGNSTGNHLHFEVHGAKNPLAK